ncbi:MAG TPA: acyl-[ACP]--phospholipid O-acyltransferase [Verrucomicrobiae bacterium]|jgi:acyl-[acyl-carrier-protein]-phospholipid O-acyltransferase/long-chain-fatty-acid--[acyl-carrier-protein] ligase|nr:acyl-[ACP]--phospholipid O-acyltransferase [Verrucomicrobiae bacterium]
MNRTDTSQEVGSLRGFWALIVTQFQGAFSDNVLKNLVIFVAIFGTTMTSAQQHQFGESIGALFSLPFILFSMAGGYLADRFSKRSVMLGVKVFELAIMSLVLAGLWTLNRHILLACVFLMGTHSAFFGPSKYGSLPELLPERKLSWGNGLLELGTFMAIILGTVAAAVLSQKLDHRQWVSGFILIALAIFGFATCFGITRIPAADPAKKFNANFPSEVWRQLRAMRGDRPLWLAVIGNTYFNFLGALLLLNLFFYGADVLHVDETHIGFLNVALALGIGLGSVAAGYLSGGKIEYGLVPLGAVGLSVFSALLALPGLPVGKALVLLALLGFTGGFFIVPIAALLQHKPSRETKGEVQATANLLSFVGVFLASGAHWLLAQKLQFSPRAIFLTGGVMTLAGAIYVLWLLPDALLRFVLWFLTRTIYRIRVVGRENVPAKGGALFVSNHLSLADAMLLLASTDRAVRFMMFKAHYELPWMRPFARMLGVIPISSEQRPREMLKSLQMASDAIKNGDVVCIFAEGQITRIGQMMPFRRGFERIMKDVEAPIIPVALDGVWGSIFSFEGGRFLWKWPRRFPHPITVNYGKAMPHTATPFEVRQAVQELMAEAWADRKERMKTLHRAFVGTARKHPLRFAMAAAQNPKVRFGAALARTIFLGRRLKKVWQGQKMVGLLLPPSVPGALVNFAAMLAGKVPVNLNYTVSEETLGSCIHQCEIKTVVTSRAFLEKVKLKVPGEVVFLEDVVRGSAFRRNEAAEPPEGGITNGGAGSPSIVEKLTAFFMALFFPVGLLERALGCEKKVELDDLATVIFSSGSTGEPKGVMLSHYNVGSNIEQLEQVFGLGRSDCVLGVLPFFHSFGFTGTLCLPVVAGVGAIYHPNPLDAKTIGPLVREYSATFLLATPTFLQLYMRGCAPEDFGSLRVVMTGAEKLPDRLAAAFEEQFGIRPLEGYGCTECSPAVAVNTHDFRSAGFRQVGAKRGKIGHPLSGVSVRIVDPDTGAALPMGQPGLMLVRGPNVMQGYLGKPEKSAEVLHDGWYTTGDIAAIDEDGFLQITDRLSRFSKIGGEMVPHIKVEERLHELAGSTEQAFVVAAVPDEKKGERLVVLHKLTDEPLQATLEKLSQTDLPNLWKPRADQFFKVESFPMLGTGKLDLRKVKEMAAKLAG